MTHRSSLPSAPLGESSPRTSRAHGDDPSAECDRYRSFFRHAAVGMAEVSPEGVCVDANPKLCELLGCRPEELVGTPIEEKIALGPELLHGFLEGTSAPWSAERHYQGPGGAASWFAITASAIINAEGRRASLLLTFNDITEARTRIEALNRRIKECQSILQTSPRGFWSVDLDGFIRDVNQAYCKVSGYTPDELIGMHVSEIDVQESSADTGRHIEELVRAGSILFETQHRRKDGSLVKIEVYSRIDPEHESRIWVFLRDLTQEQQLEKFTETVRRRALEAENALVNVSEYTLRQIGQELHDDFGQILSGAAMLADSMAYNLRAVSPRDAQTAERVTALLNEAVNRTRRISHGLYPAALEDGALVAMLKSLVEHLRHLHPLEVRFSQRGDLGLLDQEAALNLYRIVQEATSNVIRHSGASKMSITLSARPEALKISVIDNGFGIDNDRRRHRRAGLGMKTMQSRAAMIHAQLEVSGIKPHGTCVAVSLPIPKGAS